MQTLNVKSHNSNRHYEMPHFFVLSKGNNAGKPLDKPCPNCFVITTSNEEEKNRLYWLCFGLWQSRHFHQLLTGSVIPFIRISEFKNRLYQVTTDQSKAEWDILIESLMSIRSHEKNILAQLKLVHEMKRMLVTRFIKG